MRTQTWFRGRRAGSLSPSQHHVRLGFPRPPRPRRLRPSAPKARPSPDWPTMPPTTELQLELLPAPSSKLPASVLPATEAAAATKSPVRSPAFRRSSLPSSQRQHHKLNVVSPCLPAGLVVHSIPSTLSALGFPCPPSICLSDLRHSAPPTATCLHAVPTSGPGK